MKQPKTTNLKVDAAGTRKIRAGMQQSRSIKITINIDADSLGALHVTEDRLARIEKELARIKKKLAV